MLIDLSVKITAEMSEKIRNEHRIAAFGHLGTHFDVMDKEFPLEYTRRKAVVFDVSKIENRDIEISDIDLDLVKEDIFVVFFSSHLEKYGYGTKLYHQDHPQLSYELIDCLLEKKISIIGIDFPGIRRGKEHTPADQYCADRGVFIVENLCNLHLLNKEVIINTYPLNFAGFSGLPCRVIAEQLG